MNRVQLRNMNIKFIYEQIKKNVKELGERLHGYRKYVDPNVTPENASQLDRLVGV